MNLAYIQARAGSKRFPGKNLALWKGKPMVADAIEKAKATGLFDVIAVSSDSPEILQIAHDYGVLPLWRTPEASSDTATDDDVAREVLSYFPDADIVCKMYPCIPLITKTNIRELYNNFSDFDCEGVYLTGMDFKDSGSIYIFRKKSYEEYGTISLLHFPWSTNMTRNACDINTPADLEIAKQKDWR
jgi:CMP-N-acetylneuraminic acid synthetase